MNSAKEKAKDLLNQYEMQAVLADLDYSEKDSANMAIIAVNEIIAALHQVNITQTDKTQLYFWLDVRTELITKILDK